MEQPGGKQDDLSTRKDVRRGLTGKQREVAQVLYNLAKTSRSYGFYATNNRAIQLFLDEVASGFDKYLREHGMIRLVVGPAFFLFEGSEVYHDADREWGIPFRLYRDGIRSVSFKPGLGRDQLEDLLGILAKRSTTGRDAEEEDMVTLLWQRAFESITYTAVEGFTHDLHADSGQEDEDGSADSGEAIPRMMDRISGERESLLSGQMNRGKKARSFADEEAEKLLDDTQDKQGSSSGEGGGSAEGGGAGSSEEGAEGDGSGQVAPEKADLTIYPGFSGYNIPLRGGLVEIQFTEASFDEIDELRRQLDEERDLGLIHLMDYCFELSVQAPNFFGPDDFVPLLKPIRRFLLRRGDLLTFDRLLRYLRKVAQGGVYPPHLTTVAEEMLAECAGMESVAGLVAVASGDDQAEDMAWDVLQALLPSLEPVELLDMLGHSMSEHMANILAGTLISRTGSDLTLYAEAIAGNSVAQALAALRCLGTLRTSESIELVHRSMAWLDPVIRQAVVRIVGRVAFSAETVATLSKGLQDQVQDVRDETLRAMDAQGEAALAPVLWRWFEKDGFTGSDEVTRQRCATLLAELDRDFATNRLSEKLDMGLRSKVGGLMRSSGISDWNRLAVEGLAVAATPDAVEKLRTVRTKGSEEFRELVTRRLVDARRRATA
jgi:hypothetical protein